MSRRPTVFRAPALIQGNTVFNYDKLVLPVDVLILAHMTHPKMEIQLIPVIFLFMH